MPPLAQGQWTLSVCCAPHPPARLQDAEKLGYLCVGSMAGLPSPHLSTRRWSSPGEPGLSPAAAAAGGRGHVEGGLSEGPTVPSPL